MNKIDDDDHLIVEAKDEVVEVEFGNDDALEVEKNEKNQNDVNELSNLINDFENAGFCNCEQLVEVEAEYVESLEECSEVQ